MPQNREKLGAEEQLNAAGGARRSLDEAFPFEGENHLVDRGRAHAEMPLNVPFRGGPTEDDRIGINVGQVLALLWCEIGHGHSLEI